MKSRICNSRRKLWRYAIAPVFCMLLLSCNNAAHRDFAPGGATNQDTAASAPAATAAPEVPHPANMPEFPWPPPKPSSTDQLPGTLFANCHTLGSVSDKLKRALDRCGYSRKSYFYIPGGFAMVTELEQFNTDGTSVREPDRWNILAKKNRVFTLSDYLSSLFKAKPGYYRCIVFLVTDQPFNTTSTPPSEGLAEKWLDTGLNKLPAAVSTYSTNPDYDYNVLVYEFKKPQNADASQLSNPGLLTAHTHLIKSKLLDALSR
ncbi:hypothetical protein ACTHGU_10765 [Chitinophagaceae bacterium MMS25-I14]